MRRLTANVPGNPIPKGRPRLGHNGYVHTPKRTRDYEHHVACWVGIEAMKQKLREPFRGPVRVTLHFYRRDQRRCDTDNLQKAVLDALTKSGIWLDDAQVRHIEVSLGIDAENPRVEVMVEGE